MRRHIATIHVDATGAGYALTVHTSHGAHDVVHTTTLGTGAALAVDHILAVRAAEADRLRLRNLSADMEALTESALRDNRIVLGAGDVP